MPAPWPILLGPHDWALNLLCLQLGWIARRLAQFFLKKKNQTIHRLICLHFNHHGDRKSRLKFIYPKTHFSTCFLVKTHVKHRRNHDKSIYDLKKSFQEPKSTRARIYFFTNFKGKKKNT